MASGSLGTLISASTPLAIMASTIGRLDSRVPLGRPIGDELDAELSGLLPRALLHRHVEGIAPDAIHESDGQVLVGGSSSCGQRGRRGSDSQQAAPSAELRSLVFAWWSLSPSTRRPQHHPHGDLGCSDRR